MSKPPRCKICGAEHWGPQHVFNAPIPKHNVSRETIVGRFDWEQRERELGLRS